MAEAMVASKPLAGINSGVPDWTDYILAFAQKVPDTVGEVGVAYLFMGLADL